MNLPVQIYKRITVKYPAFHSYKLYTHEYITLDCLTRFDKNTVELIDKSNSSHVITDLYIDN